LSKHGNGKLVAGINGFGRFGLHVLKYWLEHHEDAPFLVAYINDDTLTLEQIHRILRTDPYVRVEGHHFEANGFNLTVHSPDGMEHDIRVSKDEQAGIRWIGEPELFLECSGKNTAASACAHFLAGRTCQVLVSATCWDADQTLVYGFNHHRWSAASRVISYGSCTVNCYVPLTAWMHERYGVVDSDVNVIHCVARHRLPHQTMVRTPCTLERSGPALLGFLPPERFAVNYTLIPHSGVSILDLRYRLGRRVDRNELVASLRHALIAGDLQTLYGIDPVDRGSEAYNGTSYNAVLIESSVKVLGDNVYLHAYLDTENSASRYFDLACYIAGQIRR